LVSVAEQMCEQGSLVIDHHKMNITKASCSAAVGQNSSESIDVDSALAVAGDSEYSRSVFVEDVPSNLVEFFQLHLESKMKGGGDIEKFICKNGGILVTFEELQGLVSCHVAVDY